MRTLQRLRFTDSVSCKLTTNRSRTQNIIEIFKYVGFSIVDTWISLKVVDFLDIAFNITAQLYSTMPELRFCTGSKPVLGVSEILPNGSIERLHLIISINYSCFNLSFYIFLFKYLHVFLDNRSLPCLLYWRF